MDSYAPSDLKALYEYINTGNATNELTHKLAAAVEFGRRNAEWKADYMRLSTHDMDTFRFGKIEGLEEGRAQGLEEGHAQGLEEGQIRTLIGMLRKNVISEQTVCDELCIDSIKLQELLLQYK